MAGRQSARQEQADYAEAGGAELRREAEHAEGGKHEGDGRLDDFKDADVLPQHCDADGDGPGIDEEERAGGSDQGQSAECGVIGAGGLRAGVNEDGDPYG